MFRQCCDLYATAEYVLMEECYEAIHAYNIGEKEHAIEECYDAIAVLIRMIDFIEDEIKNEPR